MKHIFITREIPSIAREMFEKEGYTVTVGTAKGALSPRALKRALKKRPYAAMVTLLTDSIDTEVLGVLSEETKIIANFAVGFENIDIAEANRRGIIVTNTPGVLTEAVAEHTVAFMLACASRVVEGDMYARAGMFRQWEPLLFLGVSLKDKTLGIAGAGRIGARVAEIAHRAFGMKILYHDVRQSEWLEKECDAIFYNAIDEVIRRSDVFSLHLPLNPQTTHIINKQRIASLRSDAIFVNTARGKLVDEAALAEALAEKRIRAAALDVFENEPKIHPTLRKLPNVVLTPHIASASESARSAMAVLVAKNIIAVLNDNPPETPVVR